MPTFPAILSFPSGDRYHSARIVLHVANSTWSFGLPLDAEPMGRTEGDGRCWLALEDGRVGECRWVGHDEGYLRFEGVGRLALLPTAEPVTQGVWNPSHAVS